ncbi:SDR family NAD(P)-dependent oxidoreductase [Paenibacillus sp. FSL R7-0652]|uniref:SDR family NAD(P)-dependent oxidoreductase n=1 Tax=Paenibacillus sp. FSL R7-0652 TaxID=2921687 RepID=UPI00315AF532
MEQLLKYIIENTSGGKIDKKTAIDMITLLKQQKQNQREDIAIVGISAHMPMADHVEAFWHNIENKVNSIVEFPEARQADVLNYVRFKQQEEVGLRFIKGSYLEEIDKFDYRYFKLTPKEASLMSPDQRIFLQTAWEAVEDAGYGGTSLSGTNTGLYVGYYSSTRDNYANIIADVEPESISMSVTGNVTAVLAGRISYLLNLKGPSMVVDTACSSSLVAVHMACQSIRSGECDAAIAGGVKVNTLPVFNKYEQFGIESSDGETRTFDDASDGAGVGEGVAAILLKPLSQALKDGDHIYAVIKGTAANQDGTSIGLTAPNPRAQSEAIIRAWEEAGIDPETIRYIEAHGTATELGDPIEIKGITNAFEQFTSRKQFCAIGSVKSNIGHLYECAGVTGLLKAVMALKHRKLPPSLHFAKPNRNIRFEQTPVYVNTELRPWDTEEGVPRRCGVSAFGFSGTNCHVVLEEAPEAAAVQESGDASVSSSHLFVCSAQTEKALKRLIQSYGGFLKERPEIPLENICYTAAAGRGHYEYRMSVVVKDTGELMQLLEQPWEQLKTQRGVYIGGQVVHAAGIEDTAAEERARIRRHSTQAQERIKQLGEPPSAWDEAVLGELASSYVQGANADWAQLYQGRKIRKLSLPTYPFEPSRCWIDIHDPSAVRLQDYFHTVKWVEDQGSAAEAVSTDSSTNSILIIGDGNEWEQNLAEALRNEGCQVIQVQPGSRFEQISDKRYAVGSPGPDMYTELLEKFSDGDIAEIIYSSMVGKSAYPSDLDSLEAVQKEAFYSPVYLIQALMARGFAEEIRLTLLAEYAGQVTGSEKAIAPHNALLMGLGKVIQQEYGHIQCRFIDMDTSASVEDICRERGIRGETYAVSYRDGKRYTEVFTEIDLNEKENVPFQIRPGGLYLVTGGTSGIGLETAKFLARSSKSVKLALIGRTILPSREQWKDLLHAGDNPHCAKMQGILDLEAAGAVVEYFSTDLADEKGMAQVIRDITTRHGNIHGVIHGAGIPGDGFIYRKSSEEFQTILGPKVKGTWMLEKLTQDQDMDFMMIFSSGISVIGEIGQGDYTAANCYLDSFAAWRSSTGRRTLSIDWVSWKETGMSVDFGINVDGMFKTIPTADGIKAIEAAMNRSLSRIFIGAMNYGSKHLAALGQFPFRLSDKLQAGVKHSKELADQGTQRHANRTVPQEKHTGPVDLSGKEAGAYSETEQQVARIYSEILGYQEINIYDNFFDLGGNSIMLIRMHERLNEEFPGKVKIAHLFAHTSIHKLALHVNQGKEKQAASANTPSPGEGEVKKQVAKEDEAIAIIGIAAEMPMADTAQQYWDNVVNGVDCTVDFPDARKKDMDAYHRWMNARLGSDKEVQYLQGAFLDNIDQFDYQYFRLSPKEAGLTDPIQRLFMKTSWHAVEDAGYGGRIEGTNTGVYMGFASSLNDSYLKMICDLDPYQYPMSIVGNITAMMPTRIAYPLDLKGPTMVIDTACSASLVATHLACQALRNGDCEMAIVAGARISLSPLDHDYLKVGIESSDGLTRPFDQDADGSGLGEGGAAVILKPLSRAIEDKDNVYAVIKGSAINQDGASIGITAPNPEAQTEVIVKAWEDAGIDPSTIGYVETHGTATKLGDPIEMDGLTTALRRYTDKNQFVAISSVKSNVGHLFEAAGVGSLVKAAMALKHRVLPPTLHFEKPNAVIPFQDSPLYVNTKARSWEGNGAPLRCGVSAFGFSGTNCHLVLEEPPVIQERFIPRKAEIFTLSAKNRQSLLAMIDQYIRFISEHQQTISLKNICYTVNTGRWQHVHRIAFAVVDISDLLRKLQSLAVSGFASESTGEQLYYGMHKVVTEKSDAAGSELTGQEKSELNRKGKDCLSRYLESSDEGLMQELTQKLCSMYAAGSDLDWKLLYENEEIRKISLPLYVYDNTRCWVDLPEPSLVSSHVGVHAVPEAYELVWKPAAGNSDAAVGSQLTDPAEGKTLVILDGSDAASRIVSHMEQTGVEVYSILQNDTLLSLPDTHDISDVDIYIRALQQAGIEQVSRVIYLNGAGDDDSSENDASDVDVESFTSILNKRVYAFYRWIRALVSSNLSSPVDLVLISREVNSIHGRERIRPYLSSAFGMGRVVGKENLHIQCRCIDMDAATPLDTLVQEITTPSAYYEVAFRDGVRYVQQFRELQAPEAAPANIVFDNDGVYVITGGTGGIGLETAKYMAAGQPVNLALISRTPMPAREDWDAVVAAQSSLKVIHQITTIRDLESRGHHVSCYAADVSDLNSMRVLLDQLRDQYGRIRGIVHGAGVGSSELIINRSQTGFNEVFYPKVYGTWVLDQLTQQDQLDFMVLYSSIASIFSAPGQADYIAANAYLDAYADYRTKLGKRTLTVQWSTWKETGMSADHGFAVDTLFKAMPTAQAIRQLAHVMQQPAVKRVLIGEIHYEGQLISSLAKSPFDLSSEIRLQLDQRIKQLESKRAASSLKTSVTGEVTLVGKADGVYTETERTLASICQTMLGFQEIHVGDSFFEMGADSIVLIQVHARIDQQFPGLTKVTDLFANSNITRLARFMDEQSESKAQDMEQDLKRVIDQMESGDVTLQQALNNLINL